jgi:hypothetical protein
MKSKFVLFALLGMLIMSSCSSVHRTLREPNIRVELDRNDFELSSQVTATSTQTKILGIDWKRLRHKETGSVDKGLGVISLASIPVIGDYIPSNPSEFALSELMKSNPGYDVVFYPQFEIAEKRPILGIGMFKQVITVKVTARLGKIK